MYIKEFTRDYTIIFEEMWAQALNDASNIFNINISLENILIQYQVDGVVQVWTDKEILNDFLIKLNKELKLKPDYFLSTLDTYLERLEVVNDILDNKIITSLDELKEFLTIITDIFPYFAVMYYMADRELGPEVVYQKAQEIRKEDSFYGDVNNYIRESIKRIYPKLDGMENVLLKKEIFNIPSLQMLEKRLKNFVVFFGGEEIIDLKTFAKNNPQYIFDFPVVDKSINEIKGVIAYPGEVEGIIRIVKKNRDMFDFKDGEILLSPMTIPDHVSAMKRAAAVITDEGGLLCHAAIISREFKIPCIVGLEIATEILKNGDRVAVNANLGIVRIIK